MALSGGEVIVQVLADTTGFQRGVQQASAGMTALATKTRTGWGSAALMQRTGIDKSLAGSRALRAEAQAFVASQAVLGASLDGTGRHVDSLHAKAGKAKFGFISLRGSGLAMGAGLLIGAQVAKNAIEALRVEGDAAYTTMGRLRNAAVALSHADVVGAVTAFNKKRGADTLAEAQAQLAGYRGPYSKKGENIVSHGYHSVAALFGKDVEGDRLKAQVARFKAQERLRRIIDAINAASLTKDNTDDLLRAMQLAQYYRDELKTKKPGSAAYSETLANLADAVEARRKADKAFSVTHAGQISTGPAQNVVIIANSKNEAVVVKKGVKKTNFETSRRTSGGR